MKSLTFLKFITAIVLISPGITPIQSRAEEVIIGEDGIIRTRVFEPGFKVYSPGSTFFEYWKGKSLGGGYSCWKLGIRDFSKGVDNIEKVILDDCLLNLERVQDMVEYFTKVTLVAGRENKKILFRVNTGTFGHYDIRILDIENPILPEE